MLEPLAGLLATEVGNILLASLRDAYVQVSAFVAVTVLLFSLVQYRTGGALVERLSEHERLQPLFGGLLGLTPGCGGAIVVMPLYLRGSVSFGTVVAALVATAGDSAFVILVLAPEAALVAYAIALVAGVAFGAAIDRWGLGVGRVDAAVARVAPARTDGGAVANGGAVRSAAGSEGGGLTANPEHEYGGTCAVDADRESPVLTPLSHAAHVLWWTAAAAALALGVAYLLAGAPDVPLELGATFAGAFTVVGLAGTALSVFLYGVGRHYLGHEGHARGRFVGSYDAFRHAALETSFVTVWVVVAYLVYEYGVVFTGVDVAAAAAAAGVLAPIGGAVVGLIPGCGPQIVLATVYTQGAIPFSALAANAISQDGDALFPLLAVDPRAAVVATLYTTVPALLVGVLLYVLWPLTGLPTYGFGVV